MPEQPSRDPRILEAIEACRPGSDDVEDSTLAPLAAEMEADPELRKLYEQVQRVDRSIAGALEDVAVPEGLADRITTRLASVRNGHGASESAGEGAETVAPAAPPSRRRASRRWILGGAGGAIVAASVAVAFLLFGGTPVVLEKGDIVDAASARFDADAGLEGELVAETPPPESFPAGRDFSVSKFPQIRWRQIGDFRGCKAVAYDIAAPGAARATLYVVRCRVSPQQSATPDYKPQPATRNRLVGVWQTGDLAYVLVVEGGEREYQRLLPPPTWT